jgi:glycerol-3-phosphate acyltransferase PlsX
MMGGDNAPLAMLEGVILALPELARPSEGFDSSTGETLSEIVLIGDEKALAPHLKKRRFKLLAEALSCGTSREGIKIRLLHAGETIEMEDSIRAIRKKPDASINVGCTLAAKSYGSETEPATAFVSAGHSGAMMASALLSMGRLPGVERPAIAVKLPSLSQDGCVVLDAGANIECKPEHLRDFAVMGALYARVGRKNPAPPKVGVLANGEERSKGTELTRAAADMIEALPYFSGPHAEARFTGYAEGKEIFQGLIDVVVTDGFVGNLILKSSEGLASSVFTILKQEAKRNPLVALGLLLAAPGLKRIKRKTDYAETGAAPLLGVAGYAFISHGRSNSRAIKNALLRAKWALEERFVEKMERALSTASESQTLGTSVT